jgi:predicted adenine nucleotide alpha hydrolase (AANH) superfamily ATPase
MKVLFHSCCAPCSIMGIETLRHEDIEPVLYWYNPNIHPFTEYKARRESLKSYAAVKNLALIIDDFYGLRDFIMQLEAPYNNRCSSCYRMRMQKAAEAAAANGFAYFTTSLLISPYQNHELICQAAEEAAAAYNVKFLYRDLRPLFKEGQEKALAYELYRQKYCGCIFSEEERYRKRKKSSSPL